MHQQLTRVDQHEGSVLVEDCPQELFLIKSVCKVEAWDRKREAENCQVCQRQHAGRNWIITVYFFFI